MDQTALEGMPEPAVLRLHASDGQVLVTCGRSLLYRYEAGDTGMRNLAIVALTDAGRRVDEVAAVFGLTATYVSILRGRARADGSAGLVRRRGRPPKLSERQVAQARTWAGQGLSQQSIADRLGVARSVISELLARRGPLPAQPDAARARTRARAHRADRRAPAPSSRGGRRASQRPSRRHRAGRLSRWRRSRVRPGSAPARSGAGTPGRCCCMPTWTGSAREAIFATLTGGPARRYDDLAVLSTATLGFALGIDTVEGAKHLRRAEAGAALGLAAVPELKTLRTRLAALADGSDPLALQRAFAARMLAADPAGDPVYFVDDHFVPYAGARPVGKGWNTKRRHAQPGRDDTLLVDARGRAVVFGSGEPTGLSTTLPGVLAQLRAVIGPHAPVLLGFDRGGAYPVTFTACRDAGADWVTYRRAPLVETTATPRRSWTVRDGKRITVVLADETVQINGYGQARQLTLFEHDQPVLQVLTSDTRATGADLLCWLRSRWRIENMFKYAVRTQRHRRAGRLPDGHRPGHPDGPQPGPGSRPAPGSSRPRPSWPRPNARYRSC